MTTNIAFLKILIRLVGSISGVVGLGMFYVSLMLFARGSVNTPKVIFSIILALFGAYFLWVCFCVWFRFSPIAVRHVCGLLGYFLLGEFVHVFYAGKGHAQPWVPFVFFGLLAFIFWSYRVLGRYLNRILFPAGK